MSRTRVAVITAAAWAVLALVTVAIGPPSALTWACVALAVVFTTVAGVLGARSRDA